MVKGSHSSALFQYALMLLIAPRSLVSMLTYFFTPTAAQSVSEAHKLPVKTLMGKQVKSLL